MVKITLTGEPKTTSQIYKYHCKFGTPSGYMSADGKAIKESYSWEAKAQYKRKPLEGSLEVEMKIYFGRKGKHDIDNFNKLCFDALSGIVWEDDSQIELLHIHKKFDKENPRIELIIWPEGL